MLERCGLCPGSADRLRTWILVYDISDNRLRQRAANRVARDGVRVQASSVFEVVYPTDGGFQCLQRDLRTWLDGSSDAQMRWYGMNLDGCSRSGGWAADRQPTPDAIAGRGRRIGRLQEPREAFVQAMPRLKFSLAQTTR